MKKGEWVAVPVGRSTRWDYFFDDEDKDYVSVLYEPLNDPNIRRLLPEGKELGYEIVKDYESLVDGFGEWDLFPEDIITVEDALKYALVLARMS